MVGRVLVGFVWFNPQFSVSWLEDFKWGSCVSMFSFLCHGWQNFSGVRVAQCLVFCVMVGRLLVGFVWLNLQFSASWLGDFQWGSCGSIFTLLSHGRQTFSGVRVAQYLDFCVMVGRLLVGFVWLNLYFSVSWLVDFQWGSCGSIFRFLCHDWQTFSGVRVAQSLIFCHGWQTFSVIRVAQSLVFCGMVGRLLVGFVWLNLQFYVSWLVDFQWGSCGSIFSFLCHGWQTLSGVRVVQSLVFCIMVGRLLVGFVCLNVQFSVSWLVEFQWGSCGSMFSFLCHGWQTFSGVRVAQSLVFSVMVGRFQWGSCGSIFTLLSHGRQTFSGVRVAQSLVFCLMVGRLLVGFVWLNIQISVSWLVDFQWGSCGSMFSFLCHGWQTFSGVRVAQSLVFCVMVGRLLVGFVWLNLYFTVSWSVDFQWGSCGSIFRFLCHGWQTFSGVSVAQSLLFCLMVGRLLVGFVWFNQFSVMVGRLLVGFVCSIFSFVSLQVDFQWGSCGSIFSFLCHDRQTFSGVPVTQYLVFCVMVGRLLVGFVWLNLQFSVSWQVDLQWGSCDSIFSFLCHGWQLDFQWGSCGSIFRFLCHGRQTFSGVRVAQSLVFCVMVGRLLVGFVWLNLQLSVSWQVDFQGGSCGSIQFSVSWLVDFQWGSCGSIFSFLCHGRQTFRGVRVAQSLVFCVMVGRLLVGFVWLNLQFCVMTGRFLVGFVWLNLQFSVSWLIHFCWGSCGSIFSFLCHGRQTFSGVRVA